MIDPEKVRAILSAPRKEYELFETAHQKRMQRLDKQYQKLLKEYKHLSSMIHGTTVKMTLV